VDWFNNRRLEPIGNIPPAEAEARYYVQIDTMFKSTIPPWRRDSTKPASGKLGTVHQVLFWPVPMTMQSQSSSLTAAEFDFPS
jgi:hypothetical protein